MRLSVPGGANRSRPNVRNVPARSALALALALAVATGVGLFGAFGLGLLVGRALIAGGGRRSGGATGADGGFRRVGGWGGIWLVRRGVGCDGRRLTDAFPRGGCGRRGWTC